MGIFQDVLKWSSDLPEWQSDLVRRLAQHGSVDDADLGEVLVLLKAESGLASSDAVALRFSAAHLPSGAEATSRVSLVRLADVKGVNALAAGQTLDFQEDGMTIVYGRNAAGKSGYSRILKHACKARDVKEPMLSNVFEAPQLPAEATLTIRSDGAERQVRWVNGATADSPLGAVAVLDSQCARLYVDASDAIAYMPHGLDIFPSLCCAIDELKERLASEATLMNRSAPQLATFTEGTSAAAFVASMNYKTTDTQIEDACAFGVQDTGKLNELRKLRANDPAVIAGHKRRLAERIKSATATLEKREEMLSVASLKVVGDLLVQLHETKKAAGVAAGLLEGKEMLPGTGGDPWRRLFLAAERYSIVAYPGIEFPNTKVGASCVLCQQSLDVNATERLHRFREYVDSEAQQLVTKLQRDFDVELAALRLAASAQWELDHALTEEIKEVAEDHGLEFEKLEKWFAGCASSLMAIGPESDWPQFGSCPVVTPALLIVALQIAEQVDTAEKASKPEELAKLDAAILELAGREALASAKEGLLARALILRSSYAYEKCIAGLGTRFATTKGNALTVQYVTQELVDAFSLELEELGVSAPVAISSTPDKGKVKLGVCLPGCTDSKAQLSVVLSEGEQKAVALSAFLAELNTVGHLGPIVLDDPVSSLDHNFRSKVAARLIDEAAKRQVIVFTHDIVFVNDLLAIGKEVSRLPNLVTVRRSNLLGSGVCSPEGPPVELLDCSKIVDQLRKEKPRLAALEGAASEGEYRRGLDGAYTLLRKGWEKSIESVLFNKVLRSLSDEVQPGRLAGVTVVPEDGETINRGFGHCSSIMHRMAETRDAPLPSTDDFMADVKALDDFVQSVKARRKVR